MPQNFLIRILLLPFSLMYGIAVGMRRLLYRTNILRSVRFNLPVISVGNLSIGGAGKSPHTEYLICWLHQYIDVAVLSRGYGRQTTGFLTVHPDDHTEKVGDEPLQIKRKFPDVPVVVSESRAFGVPELLKHYPSTQCVLLDDAFQHLAVTPGLQILLTEFAHPFTRDWLLPAGRLREWRIGYRRADLIIVTKCPDNLSTAQKQQLIAEIDPFPWQKIFFSRYEYGQIYHLNHPEWKGALNLSTEVLLVAAIANVEYLIQYLKYQVRRVHTLEYIDHHPFSLLDVEDIKKHYHQIPTLPQLQKIVLTTEKDAVRLEKFHRFFADNQIPVFVLPVSVRFLDDDEARFQSAVRQFLLDFKV